MAVGSPGKKHVVPYWDVAIAMTVFLVVVSGSWGYLTVSGLTPGPEHGDSEFMIVSAALWATGHTFSIVPNPFMSIPPAFLDFLTHKTDALQTNQFPHELFLPLPGETKFIYDRLYLLYAMGILWRIVEISWSSLNILVSFFAGLTAAITYGIFRLGMGRSIAFVGTLLFVSSPLFLTELPALRDFCKAPFILGALLAIGYLLSRSPRKPGLVVLAAAIGLFTGIGMGFRQDIIIVLPPLVVSLLFARDFGTHGKQGILANVPATKDGYVKVKSVF